VEKVMERGVGEGMALETKSPFGVGESGYLKALAKNAEVVSRRSRFSF
jgi:hypothetical protein